MSKNKLLILDKELNDIDIIIKSISSDVRYIIYEDNDLYGTLLNKILNLNLEQINDIGFIRKEKKSDTFNFLNENSIVKSVELIDPKLFSWKTFKKLLISIKVLFNLKVFNFISCNLNNNIDFQYIFSKLEETGVIIGASSYKIGNKCLGGSWILDRNNYDIKDNYFTDEILNYNYLFDETNLELFLDNNNIIYGSSVNLTISGFLDNGYLILTDNLQNIYLTISSYLIPTNLILYPNTTINTYYISFFTDISSNYNLTNMININVMPLELNGNFNGINKFYDGITNASIIYTLSGILFNDIVDITSYSANYITNAIGCDTIYISNIILNNNNYIINDTYTNGYIYPNNYDISYNLLIIDNKIKNLSIFLNSINYNSAYIILDSKNDTFDTLNKKIYDLSINSFNYLGLVRDEYYGQYYTLIDNQLIPSVLQNIEILDTSMNSWSEITNFFFDLKLKYNFIELDWISCSLESYPEYIYIFNYLSNLLNIPIGASTDPTGNLIYGGDWILETTNTNIESIYLNENILSYQDLLGPVTSYTNASKTTQNGYTAYRFTTNGTITLSTSTSFYFLVIGGGGGGGGGNNAGNSGSGGGGGGGIYYNNTTPQTFGAGTYTITVGSGGTGAARSASGGTGGTSSITGTGINISTPGGNGGIVATGDGGVGYGTGGASRNSGTNTSTSSVGGTTAASGKGGNGYNNTGNGPANGPTINLTNAGFNSGVSSGGAGGQLNNYGGTGGGATASNTAYSTTNGGPGTYYGGGGGAARCDARGTTYASVLGGTGSPGLVILWQLETVTTYITLSLSLDSITYGSNITITPVLNGSGVTSANNGTFTITDNTGYTWLSVASNAIPASVTITKPSVSITSFTGTFTSSNTNAFTSSTSSTGGLSYPPNNLTGYTTSLTGLTYGNGTYTVSASVERNGAGTAAYAFNSSQFWQINPYPTLTTTVVSGITRTGEWVQIIFPSSLIVDKYSLTTTASNNPLSWIIAGSNNSSTWTFVDSQTYGSINANTTYTFNILNNITGYTYYRFIYLSSNGTYPTLSNLKFYQYASTISISKATLTGTYTGINKVYNKTTTATITASFSGIISGDTVNLSSYTANFASANVGTGISITITGITISNSNYTVASTGSTTANITQATLTGTYTGINKIYNGLTTATITGSFSGVVIGDTVNLSSYTANFASANVGTGISITITGITISNSNYTVASTGSTTANITQATLTGTYTGINKIYNGLTTATITASFSGIISGDTVNLSSYTANFASANVGTGISITITGITISNSNYTVASTGSTTANITQATLTGTYTGINKVYNGLSTATITASFSGVVIGDTVNLSSYTANFASANVGTGISITITSITISNSNYTVASTGSSTANITQATLTGTYTGINKIYNGLTTATIIGSFSGIISGDTINLSSYTANFASANVGTGISITITSITISNSNYTVASTGSTTANITQATLTGTYTGIDKLYDTTNNATIIYTLSGIYNNNSVSITNYIGKFRTPYIGTNILIDISNITIDNTNYTLATFGLTSANILPYPIIPYFYSYNKIYDKNKTAYVYYNLSGIFYSDISYVSINNNLILAKYRNYNVGTNIPIDIINIRLNGLLAYNYISPIFTTIYGSIESKNISAIGNTVTYNKSITTPITISGLINKDSLIYTTNINTINVGNNILTNISISSLVYNTYNLNNSKSNITLVSKKSSILIKNKKK